MALSPTVAGLFRPAAAARLSPWWWLPVFATTGKGQRNPANGKGKRKKSATGSTLGKTPRNTTSANCCCGCPGTPCAKCGTGTTPIRYHVTLSGLTLVSTGVCYPWDDSAGSGVVECFYLNTNPDPSGTYTVGQVSSTSPETCQWLFTDLGVTGDWDVWPGTSCTPNPSFRRSNYTPVFEFYRDTPGFIRPFTPQGGHAGDGWYFQVRSDVDLTVTPAFWFDGFIPDTAGNTCMPSSLVFANNITTGPAAPPYKELWQNQAVPVVAYGGTAVVTPC